MLLLVKVSRKISPAIQEYLFSKGFKWKDGCQLCIDINPSYFEINIKDKLIAYWRSGWTLKEILNEYKYHELFINNLPPVVVRGL